MLGTILGVAAAVLTAAAFGVIGLLDPSGSADWRQGGQVIVERETGARYVLGQDGLLHPVLNYASARLLAGGNADQTVTVSQATLGSASRGTMLGAPDSLPASKSLSDSTFTSCSRVRADLAAAAPPVATVILGATAPAGRPLRGAVLVTAQSGDEFLITDGHRFPLTGQAAITALGYEGAPSVSVSDSWLDTVPVGRPLGLAAQPDAGAPGPVIDGTATRVGEVLSDGAFYLVGPSGVTPIGEPQARLVLGDSANAAAYPGGQPGVVHMSVAALDSAPRTRATDTGYPMTMPAITPTDPDTVLCSVGGSTISTADQLPLPQGARVMSIASTDDRVADEVYVPPGTGTLVREQVGAGSPGSTYLITDAGMKYPVPSTAAAAALGYAAVGPAPVAGTLLALLPTGPSLDPVAARQVVAR